MSPARRRRRAPVISAVLEEQSQSHGTRSKLFSQLERVLGRPVVSFFTSFRCPVLIDDTDADILNGLLQELHVSNGLALVISSPGGDGLAAERIIRICRTYTGEAGYWTIVPSKAKSAATMICMGAQKIIMGPTSELGPVDPQVPIVRDNWVEWYSASDIVESYHDLFRRAVAEKGNLHPYLQQLERYDQRQIKHYERAQELAEDIAVRALATGMMKGVAEDEIREKIGLFLQPEKTLAHGRAIDCTDAGKCGLTVEQLQAESEEWRLIYELYVRTDKFVSTSVAKCLESKVDAYHVPAPTGGQQ